MAAEEEYILRVRGSTPAKELASAISHGLAANKNLVLRAVGAGAVNQAVKAVIIASGLMAPQGVGLLMQGGFVEIKMPDGDITTGIKIRVVCD